MNLAWLLVAVVYAAAIAASRRVPWRVAALFYLLVLAFFFKPMTGRYVSLPTDVVQLISPWSSLARPGLDRTNVSNHEMQDTVFQMAPWAHQVRESWKELKPPLWNGLAGTGQPLMANMQSQALSPLRIAAMPLPLGYAMTAEAAMKVLIALTFTFLYCRRRYDELPSVIGAIAFGFGTFVITWLHWPHATVAVFLPAVLYAIDLIAERITFGRIVFAAVLGPMILFGGHPETTAHIVFFATVYALWVSLKPRHLGALAAACVIAALLSAPLLLPFLESMRNTVRYQDLKLRPHADATAYSDFASLVPLFHPWFGERAETISGFAGFLGIAAWFGLLIRCIARREFRSIEMFFVLATVMVFAIIDDWPISAPFRHLFALSLNSRMRLMFCFLAAVMTAALVHHAKRERLPLIASLAGGVGLLVFLQAKAELTWVALVPSIAVLIAAATRIRIAIAAALFVELWLASHHWIPVRPASEFYPPTPLIDALLRLRGSEPYRIAGLDGALFPNTQALFDLEDARVHDAMANARYARVLGAAMPYDPLEYYPKFKDPDTPLLDALNVKWFVTDPGVELRDRARYRLLYDGRDGRIYENRNVMPRFVAPGANVNIVRATNDAYELRVDAPHETLIKASIAFWPGWRVTHNGNRLKPGMVDDAFLAFVVPPGAGTVRLRYVPLSFWSGVAIALVTCVAISMTIRRRAV